MEYIFKCENISKRYSSGVLANDNVGFDLVPGEVHALLGENGAGKSTLVKIFYGLEQPDSGTILLHDTPLEIKNSAIAIENGIGMVHQELMLIPNMTVAENVMLGQEILKAGGRLDTRAGEAAIHKLALSCGFDIDPAVQVSKLPIGVQQRVEILKLLYRKANILILDEPTALLTPNESDTLFEIIRSLTASGKSIIFITHKLKEVYQIADRMTVMRQGRMVATTTPADTDQDALVEMMVGRSISTQKRQREINKTVVLEVENLTINSFSGVPILDDLSFNIRAGEILGVAGIEGNGQTQLAQALLGLIKTDGGLLRYSPEGRESKQLNDLTTRDIRDIGVGSIPDDRQGFGLVLPFSVYENMVLNSFAKNPYSPGPLYTRWDLIRKDASKIVDVFDVRCSAINVPVSTLSGGNQQKLVVGRELSVPLQLLIASQPTRGVDVASANFIQQKIVDAADEGTSVLLISSDLDELLQVSDRIMVLLRGQNVGTVRADKTTREQLGRMMMGVA